MHTIESLKNPMNDQLFEAILKLKTVEECYDFFEDICTIRELCAISQRLEVARLLSQGEIYEDIVEQTGASTATISRVKRVLTYGAGGYRRVLEQMATKKDSE